MQDKDIVTVEG